MALQIQVETILIRATETRNRKGFDVTFKLSLWNEGDDPQVDTPVLTQDFSKYVKGHVEGLTTQELIQRAESEFINDMQVVINQHKKEQNLLANPLIEQARANIETGLEG